MNESIVNNSFSATTPPNTPSIAISGVGVLSAAGVGWAEHETTMEQWTVYAQTVPKWLFETNLLVPVFVGPQKPLSTAGIHLLKGYAPTMPLTHMSRTLLLQISVLADALNESGLSRQQLHTLRIGIALGVTVACTYNNPIHYWKWRRKGGSLPEEVQPVYNYLDANLCRSVQQILGVSGPTALVVNACASGSDAIGIAMEWLQQDQCDIAIAGGADELSRVALNGFESLQLIDPKPCRPFNQDRQGLTLGEGAACLILEREKILQARDGPIQGWVRGYGAAADAWHPTAPHPQGRGLQASVRQALKMAGIFPQQLGLINAHGTATPTNDLAETTALSSLAPHFENIPLVSTKGMTGHTLGAAGAIEAVLTLLTLRRASVPGSVGCTMVDPALPLVPLAEGEQAPLTSRFGLSNSLAFGGCNAALVLEAVP